MGVDAADIAKERNRFNELCAFLPRSVAGILLELSDLDVLRINEIRLRRNAPVAICCGRNIYTLGKKGIVEPKEGYILTADDLAEAWRYVTASSVYALEEEVRRGYVTLRGGHRVGIAGTAVIRDGLVRSQKDIFSLNYRISRECRGIGLSFLPYLFKGGVFQNTLIISPPGGGKTTLVRDLTRLLSDGTRFSPRHNVALIDERAEVAAVFMGRACHDVGAFTDILTGFPKSEGMLLALRSLGPGILVTDEIGSDADRIAVADALRSGVSLLLTAHGNTMEELRARPVLKDFLQEGVFHRILFLSPLPRPGTVRALYQCDIKEGWIDYRKMDLVFSDSRVSGDLRRDLGSGFENAAL